MKKLFIKFALIFVSVIFFSCEDVVQVDLPEGENVLVVDAWLNDKDPVQKIKLSGTVPYFSQENIPPALGANVEIKDITSGKSFSFIDNNNSGNYIFQPTPNDSFAVVGHKYQLIVTWNGNSYHSFTTLNPTAELDTVGFQDIKEFGSNEISGFAPYLYGTDFPARKDYYWFKAFKNNIFYGKPSNINIAEDGGGGNGTDGLCFIPPVAFFSVIDFDDLFQLYDTCKIEIHSIAKDTYEYLLQMQIQLNNSQAGLFSTTLENLRTNILPVNNSTRAVGWFSFSSVSTRKDKVTLNWPVNYNCP